MGTIHTNNEIFQLESTHFWFFKYMLKISEELPSIFQLYFEARG